MQYNQMANIPRNVFIWISTRSSLLPYGNICLYIRLPTYHNLKLCALFLKILWNYIYRFERSKCKQSHIEWKRLFVLSFQEICLYFTSIRESLCPYISHKISKLIYYDISYSRVLSFTMLCLHYSVSLHTTPVGDNWAMTRVYCFISCYT